MYDLIIRNGNIVDGTGRKEWVRDVAIEDGLIIEAGRKIMGSAHREGFEAPRMAWDLPGGAPRFVQRAHGYLATICRGEVTVEDDEFTGNYPGRLIGGRQSYAGPVAR